MAIQQPRFVDGRSLAVDLQTPANAIAGGLTRMFDNQRQEQQAKAKQQQIQEQQQQMQDMQDTYTDLSAIKSLAPEKREAFINQRMVEYESAGDFESAANIGKLLDYLGQGNLDSFIDPQIGVLASQLGIKDGGSFTLGEGQTRYDASGNVVAQGGEKQKNIKLTQIDKGDAIELIDSSTGELVRLIPKSGNNKADEKAVKDQERIFKQTNELRSQVRKVDPDFIKVQDAYTNVKASAKDPSAAGDLALIFNYMKTLDPGSTVREGEFATAQSAGGVNERIYSLYNQVLEGTRLSEPQRKDFLDRATRLYKANVDKFKKRTQGIVKQAGKFNIPLEEIGLNYNDLTIDETTSTPAMPKTTAPQSAIQFLINNPDQINAFEQKYGYRPEGF